MKKILLTLSFGTLLLAACATPTNIIIESEPDLSPDYTQGETATFAGGCFWCMEPPFENVEGTLNVVVGYAGGEEKTANYKDTSTGKTNHREAVEINYDPEQVSYEALLETFFQQIDPTDNGGQFTDRGFQYTTAIYYHNDIQKQAAETFINTLERSEKFEAPIATSIEPYTTFFLAEEYHQNFYLKSAEHYEKYAKGSGRKDFIAENWAKEAALEQSR